MTRIIASDEFAPLLEDAEEHRSVSNVEQQTIAELERDPFFRDTRRLGGEQLKVKKSDVPGYGENGLENIRAILRLATPEEVDYFGTWYKRAHNIIAIIADRYDVPMDVACAIVAVLSPGLRFRQNLKAAVAVLSKNPQTWGAYKANRIKADKILETGDTKYVSGPKVTDFFQGLLHPEENNPAVLDGHAIGIWRGDDSPIKNKRRPSEAERAAMQRDYAIAGKDLGISAQSAQALSWVLWKAIKATGGIQASMKEPMTDIRTYIDSLASHDATTITAASLGRIQQHVSNLREKQFAILTPFRRYVGDTVVTPAENKARLVSFKQDLRSRGYGYIPMTGHWEECMDQTPYEECDQERKIDSVEPSFLVPNMALEDAVALGKKYQQDGIIYGGPATEGRVKVIFMSGGDLDLGDTFTTTKIGQGFSALDPSRKFSFVMLNEESPMTLQAASLYATKTYGKMPYSLVTGLRVL